MNLRRAFLSGCAVWLACLRLLPGASQTADELGTTPDVASTVASEAYPQVTCTGTNPAVISDVLQLATDTRESLAPLLKLGKTWRFPVHINIAVLPTESVDGSNQERTLAIADGKSLSIEARLTTNDPNPREFIQRQFVTALLWEKYFKPDSDFTPQTRLDIVPLWLVEGLREWLNDDPDHNREEIVKRAALADHAPTLAEVTGWHDLSDDTLLNLWQRAFCYYLVDSLVQKKDRRADFEQWIATITGPEPTTANRLFPTEMGWQRELRDAAPRSRSLFFSWEESAAELSAAEPIALPKGKHSNDTRLCTIETVSTFARTKEISEAIAQKIMELTGLQLRVHPSWQPIVQDYRFGLTALLRDKDPSHAAKFIADAHARRSAEMAYHEKLVDYANWFEVTQSTTFEKTHFDSYFRTAQLLDKAEADPAHPNPIRDHLLKVEAQF